MNEISTFVDGDRMTSLQIAEITARLHKNVMRAIRNMEPAWEKINGRNFELVDYKDEKGETNMELGNKITEMLPKVSYYDKILQSNATMTVTQIAQDYGMTAMRLNKELESMRIQHKVRGQWILFAQFLEGGYVHSRAVEIVMSDGRHDVKYNTEWTTKGRIFLYESLKAKGILPLIEQENTPSDKGTGRTEPAKAASASQQTIKFN